MSTATRGDRERVRPPVPETKRRKPRELPNLSQAKVIAVDTETYDPGLLSHGPGYVRPGIKGEPRDGWIVGVSLATDDRAWYFPLRHPDSDNFAEETFYPWLRKTLGAARQPKVGANIGYDIGWLDAYDVIVKGALYDVQYAEPLLDEHAFTYDLERLGQKYEGTGKDTSLLYAWCADAFGGRRDSSQRANIWRAPAVLVGAYAEQDAALPLRIIRKQIAQLKKENLLELFKLETSLIPLLLEMRKRGVRVDLEKAEKTRKALRDEEKIAQEKLDALVGSHVNVNAPRDLAEAFDAQGIKYPRTAKGAPSFKKAWLEALNHPLAQLIGDVRTASKLAGTFVDSYIFGQQVNGRVHTQFHPLRTDSNGTESGRFASSNPNLQNIPARNPRLASLVRGIFCPDDGAVSWKRFDYSQIEYRFLVHFASGLGADDARMMYRKNPKTDFHAMVTELVKHYTRIELSRDVTKNVNFGLVYGMMRDTLRRFLNLSEDAADKIFKAYHEAVPFVQHTYNRFALEAHASGEIRTVLRRKSRFVWYESAVSGVRGRAMLKDDAKRAYGFIKPANTHKALNRVLQGSSADQMKQAMSDAYYAGVFDSTGVPHVTVHDELGLSNMGTPESVQGFKELTHIMETCIPLSVPVLVSVSDGADWGACK